MIGHARRLKILSIAGSLLFLLAACSSGATGSASQGDQLKDVSFVFSWKYSGHRSPYLLAEKMGFWADRGLNVTIKEGSGSDKAVDLLATGKVDFAEVEFGTLVVAVRQGRPITTVATVLQDSPQCLVAWDDANINSIQDLEGKQIVAVPGGSDTQMLGPLFSINDVNPDRVHVISADFNTRDQIFLSHDADAMPTFINDSYVTLHQQHPDTHCLLYADYGVDLIGNGVAVRSSMIQDDPDTVRAFVAGLKEGWEYAEQHPDEAISALLDVAPLLKADEELPKLEATFPLVQSSHGWGYTDPEQAATTEDLLLQSGTIDEKASDPSVYYTNGFVQG